MLLSHQPLVQTCISAKPSKGLRRWVLCALAAALCVGLLAAKRATAQSPALTDAPAPSFEVAVIKPNHSADLRTMMMFRPGRFEGVGVTVKRLMGLAYDVKDFQIAGGPNWIGSERFDIQAKESDATAEELRKLPVDETRKKLQLMLQSLLTDRFALKLSHDSKELPLFALRVAKNGPKLHEAKPGDTYSNGIKGPDGKPLGKPGMIQVRPGRLTGQGLPMDVLVRPLSQILGRDVLDQTSLKGKYDFTLEWTPDESQTMFKAPPGANPGADAPPPPDPSGPSLFTAIQEQLGLKLESTKGSVDILVIDHVEQPSEN